MFSHGVPPRTLSQRRQVWHPQMPMEVLCARASPVRGWRSGSTETSWQTSVSRSAVISLISLWRIDGKPPRGHERTCSTEKKAPQSQCLAGTCCRPAVSETQGIHEGALCRLKPNSEIGSEVSQLEAPLSLASQAPWYVPT